MAATMVGCRLSRLSSVLPSVLQIPVNYASTTSAYYVLLPEIPPDTPETNPIMRLDAYPKFSEITPQLAVTGCAKLAIDFDVQLGKHVETLKDGKYIKNFTNVFDPLERVAVPLSYAWRTAKNLNYVRSSDGFRAAFQRIHPQVERAKNERWINPTLYTAVKEVNADRKNLTEYQQRLVDMYLLEGRLNGIELSGLDKRKFIEFLGKIVDAKSHYRNRVMLSHNLFSHTIDDFATVVEVPRQLLAAIAYDKMNPSRGPWKVTLNQNIYQPFLEYCSDRLTRWNVWQAFNNRSSIGQDELNLSNHAVIETIRNHRRDIAKSLGYENFAEMSMETKMAGSIENVLGMIDSLRTRFQPLAEQEITRLQEFARSEGFTDKLQMWDLPYWRRRQRQHLYRVDETDVMAFFPFPHVLNYLFQLCDTLFGVTIKDCTSDVEVWQADVRCYKMFDKTDNRYIASFFIDPYLRPTNKLSGTWMECGRERSDLMGTTPISYLNLNLMPPTGGQPSLMTFDQLNSLFYEFGHGLQQMLTTVPYSELAGQRNVEWDSLQTSANVLSMILHNRHTLRSMSCNYHTNKPLSDDQIDVILKSRQHMSSYDIMRQLYFSAYDMEIYINEEHWSRTMRRVWKEFMPLPLHEDDNHPCSFSAIFSDQYAAAYYSLKWSEMIAADIMKEFEEAGLDNKEKVAVVGRKFRDTYLSLGGAVPADEVFRRFRGRDPTDDAMIARYLTT